MRSCYFSRRMRRFNGAALRKKLIKHNFSITKKACQEIQALKRAVQAQGHSCPQKRPPCEPHRTAVGFTDRCHNPPVSPRAPARRRVKNHRPYRPLSGQRSNRRYRLPVPISAGKLSGGNAAIMARRWGSNQGGKMSCSPKWAGSSSTAKPGPSVASSNRTPPGSRK